MRFLLKNENMPVFELHETNHFFPPPSLAESNGLLAVGGDLSAGRLLNAYQSGIFPWFQEDGLFFWYSPDPRCVVLPSELKVHKSMRSVFNQHKFRYSIDTCFEKVMEYCAQTPRKGEHGTWINQDFMEAYWRLHSMGVAHSMEVWEGETLVGGLYGVSLGKMFFGESMFSRATNASKAGFITLVKALRQNSFVLIDCQLETAHLMSLGARRVRREWFLDALDRNAYEKTLIGKWTFDEKGGICVRPDADRISSGALG